MLRSSTSNLLNPAHTDAPTSLAKAGIDTRVPDAGDADTPLAKAVPSSDPIADDVVEEKRKSKRISRRG